MPTTTTEVFRWTGTGYNSQYNTSYTAELTDDDGSYDGGSDNSESVTIDGGGPFSTTGAAYAINVSFTATDSSVHVETFYFFNASGGGGWYFTTGPNSEFTVGATLGSYQNHTVGWDYTDVICFTPGAKIATPLGGVNVQDLAVGDLVITKDNGLQAVRWIGRKAITGARMMAYPNLRPIKIKKNSIAPNVPDADISFSPQHRILMSGDKCELAFGRREVLAPCKSLVDDYSILVDHHVQQVEYIHILFSKHEVIFANGLETESFHPSVMGMEALEEAGRAELFEVFPELRVDLGSFGDTARISPRASETAILK